MSNEHEEIGNCPLCGRVMWKGTGVNRHHFVPKSQGGKENEYMHRICHTKIHSLFNEKELAKRYNTPEALLAEEEIQKFVKWVAKKDPDFYDANVKSSKKR